MVRAFILINTDSGLENEVANKVLDVSHVKCVHTVYGVYDVIVEIETNNYEELRAAISKIRSIAGIRSTTTLIVTK